MEAATTRREFVAAAGAAALTMGAPAEGTARQAARRPRNVLMLLSDDQRHDTVGALGNRDIRTPNLDRLVREGTALTHACTMGGRHGALCIPSRAMLLTGRMLFHAPDQIPAGVGLWPEELRKAGYTTFGTGKWHNNRDAFARAFSCGGPVFFGGMSDHARVPVQDFDPEGRYPDERARVENRFSSELFTDSLVRFLRDRRGAEPFMAYVAYTAPHDPRMAPEPYASMYPPERIPLPPNFLPGHPFDNGEIHNRDEDLAPFPRTPEVVRRHIADYYAMITHLDAQIGRVLDTLRETGLDRDTLVVFAGDNGLALGQHGLLGKQSLYEHSMRVPLIFSGPGVPRGARRDALCYLLDVYPTVCDLMGVAVPASVEGASLEKVLRGDADAVRDSLFLPYRDLGRAVRDRRWKLIEYRVAGERHTQLFDLRADPWETHDFSNDPEHQATLERMRALLARWQRETGDPAGVWTA